MDPQALIRLTDSLNACVHNNECEHVCVRNMFNACNMQCQKYEWLFTHVQCTLQNHVTTNSFLFQHSPAVTLAFGADSKAPAPGNITNACAMTKSNRNPGVCPRVFWTATSSKKFSIRSTRRAHPVACATTPSIQAILHQVVSACLHSKRAVRFASQKHWLQTQMVAPTL